MHTLQSAHMIPDVTGRMTFMHKLNLYVHSVLERQIRLYECFCNLEEELLVSIGILEYRHISSIYPLQSSKYK